MTLALDNQDDGVQHNWALYDTEKAAKQGKQALAATNTQAGPGTREVTFTVNWDPAIHIPLKDDFQDPLPRNYQIVLPNPPGGTWTFAAFLTGMGHEYPYDDKMAADFTFKISGALTFV